MVYEFFGTPGDAIMSLTLIVVIPAAILSQRIDSFVRKLNIQSAHAADRAAERLDLEGIQRECMKGIKRFYLAYVLIFFMALSIGTTAVYFIYPLLPTFALTGLGRFYSLLPLIGIASLLSLSRIKNAPGVLLTSFAVFFGFFEVIGW